MEILALRGKYYNLSTKNPRDVSQGIIFFTIQRKVCPNDLLVGSIYYGERKDKKSMIGVIHVKKNYEPEHVEDVEHDTLMVLIDGKLVEVTADDSEVRQ